MIDSFDYGPFSLINDRSSEVTGTQIGGMLGGSRFIGISTARRSTVVTSEIISGSSLLTFDTGDGPALGTSLGEGYIRLRWVTNPAMSLIGFENFLLDVATLQGTGQVNIGINRASGAGSGSTWIPLSASGILLIPFDKVDVEAGSLAGVTTTTLTISGTSADFSLAIGSFTVVPEPSPAALFIVAIVLSFSRRNRRC